MLMTKMGISLQLKPVFELFKMVFVSCARARARERERERERGKEKERK